MALYFIGERFFNKWTGLVASLLVLTSTSINVWSILVHLDHIMPFFMLLGLLFSYLALEKRRYVWFALAGVSLGLGFLVKETTVFFFPLPVLAFLWVKAYRRREIAVGLGIYAVVLAIVLLPWVARVYHVRGDLQAVITPGATSAIAGRLAANPAFASRGVEPSVSEFRAGAPLRRGLALHPGQSAVEAGPGQPVAFPRLALVHPHDPNPGHVGL